MQKYNNISAILKGSRRFRLIRSIIEHFFWKFAEISLKSEIHENESELISSSKFMRWIEIHPNFINSSFWVMNKKLVPSSDSTHQHRSSSCGRSSRSLQRFRSQCRSLRSLWRVRRACSFANYRPANCILLTRLTDDKVKSISQKTILKWY